MNTASLDLCKELYELSGWRPKYWWDYSTDAPAADPTSHKTWYVSEGGQYPAYDLGYLLRKLPDDLYWTMNPVDIGGQKSFTISTLDWYNERKRDALGNADTPTNAAAKLCIELWKQGVLK